MANHFSTIGIPLTSRESLIKIAELTANEGASYKTAQGTYKKFAMGNGVELWGQLNHDNEIIGINPHFSGTAVTTVRIVNKVEDANDNELDGKVYAEVEPGARGEFTYPFVFDLPNMAIYQFSFPEIAEVQLAAFAHELSIYKDDEEYETAQEDGPKLAAEAFIPSGLFTPDSENPAPPQAMAIFTGHVLYAEKLQNPYTGAFFQYMKVKSLGGEFDVVADSELCSEEIPVGGVISGSFWLTGKLIKK